MGERGIPENAQEPIIKFWREGTKLQYNCSVENGFVSVRGNISSSASVNKDAKGFFLTNCSHKDKVTLPSAVSNFLKKKKKTANIDIHRNNKSLPEMVQ